MLVIDRVYAIALERCSRQSTLFSYERRRAIRGIFLMNVQDVSQEAVPHRLWTLEGSSTRRPTVIALRSVFGWKVKIPRSVPKRYDLADEDTLRVALMTSPHEARGLLMMYGGRSGTPIQQVNNRAGGQCHRGACQRDGGCPQRRLSDKLCVASVKVVTTFALPFGTGMGIKALAEYLISCNRK